MLDYQKRVIAERDDLSVKIEKLGNFLISDSFDDVDKNEQIRLEKQCGLMLAYEEILNERIANFESKQENEMDNQEIEFNVGNYYGALAVKEENGKYYWSIENYDGHHWEEISKVLYMALVKFAPRRD